MLSPAELGHHPAVLSCLPGWLHTHTLVTNTNKVFFKVHTYKSKQIHAGGKRAHAKQTLFAIAAHKGIGHTHTQVHIHFITFTIFASTHCELHSCMVKSSFSHLLPFNKHKFEFLSALFLRGLHTTVHQKPRAASWTHMQRKCGTFRENLFTNTNCRK